MCGDESTKQSPLLVWDLGNRKLLHSLRLAGHEFISYISAISKDGNFVVVNAVVSAINLFKSKHPEYLLFIYPYIPYILNFVIFPYVPKMYF